MNKNKSPKNLIRNIIILVILVSALIGIIWTYAPSGVETKTSSYFTERAITNANNLADNNYFTSLKFNDAGPVVEVQEMVGGVLKKYVVILNIETARNWQSINGAINLEGVAPNLSGIQLLKNGSQFANAKPEEVAAVIEQLGFPKEDVLRKLFFQLLPTLLLLIIFIGIFIYVRKSANSGGAGGAAGGLFNPGRNQAQKITSKVRFSDVAGNAEAKEEIMELVDYLKNPKKYSSAGARIPKGILLGGPPGTGKTLLAKATAGEAEVPFFFISASNFVEMYVGVGAKRVRELFKDARKSEKAIIFIDELDAVGRSRGAGMGGGNDEREQTLNQLLVEMDGMEENSGILVIAATNRVDVLDPALQRPGRFDRSIVVNLPDIKEREEILRLHAKGKKLSSEIKFSNIAKRTPGYSGAQLENVINEASILSVREKTKYITGLQIDEAIDRVMSGPAKKNRVITEEERTMVAYHEAGHAVVGIRVPGGNRVQKITIIPRGDAGGYNLMLPEKEKYNATKSELEAMIASFMGGRAAEEIIYGKEEISTGAANDIEKATKIARKMVTQFGMSSLGPIQYEESQGSPFLGRDYNKNFSFSQDVANEVDKEVRIIISKAMELAKKTISSNLKLLDLIKDELLDKETIVSEEIEYLSKNIKRLPKKTSIPAEKAEDNEPDKSLDDLIKEVKKEDKEKRNSKTK